MMGSCPAWTRSLSALDLHKHQAAREAWAGVMGCDRPEAGRQKRSARLEWRTPKTARGTQVEGGRHDRKADSDRQISLSISVDFQAIVAHAACAGAGPGDRLSRSEALHLPPDQGADRPSRLGPEQGRGRAR